MDKYGLAIYNENRVKKRLSTYLDCGGLASVIFPTMDIMGNYGEEPILIWQSSPRGRGRRRAKCKIIALEGGIENG